MSKSESIKELTVALAKAHLSFKAIKKTETVDFTTKTGSRKKYSYAELSGVIEATKEALGANGLAVTQITKLLDGNVILETLLSHSSGEWVSGELYVGKQDQPPQEEGSAMTYKRRYGLSAILGVASEEDDDAEAATNHKQQEQPKSAEKPASAGEMITEAQRRKLFAVAKEKGLEEAIPIYMVATFKKTSSTLLTKNEASQLIDAIEKGDIKSEKKPDTQVKSETVKGDEVKKQTQETVNK